MPKYDLLLRGGHVIDPANGIDGPRDVGVSGRAIGAVQADIPETEAARVAWVDGWYVVPGLVDLHAHSFGLHAGSGALSPDEMCLPYGVTTMVDCAGTGWRNFDAFERNVVVQTDVRVFVLLNVAGFGMAGSTEQDVSDMDPEANADFIKRRGDILVGVKSAHFMGPGWESVDCGVETARLSGTFCLIDQFGRPTRPFEKLLLEHMNPGDGLTRCYALGRPMIGNDGKVKPAFVEARERGIKFDVGHGAERFSFSMAIPALEQGFPPDAISTDMHRWSFLRAGATMPEVMSKFLAMGMPMAEVVERSTVKPAEWINHTELGTLTPGAPADIAVLEFQDRPCGLIDSGPTGYRIMQAEGRLINQITILEGAVRFDYDGHTKDDWSETPKTDTSRSWMFPQANPPPLTPPPSPHYSRLE